MLLEVRHETEVHFLVGTVILGFLSIFMKSQASSPFEALTSVCLSMCQRDVRPLSKSAETCGFLYGLHRGFRHAFIL